MKIARIRNISMKEAFYFIEGGYTLSIDDIDVENTVVSFSIKADVVIVQAMPRTTIVTFILINPATGKDERKFIVTIASDSYEKIEVL